MIDVSGKNIFSDMKVLAVDFFFGRKIYLSAFNPSAKADGNEKKDLREPSEAGKSPPLEGVRGRTFTHFRFIFLIM